MKKTYGSKWLWDLEEKDMAKIDMANLKHYDLMKIIGRQMGEYICGASKNFFRSDLVNEQGNDQLVTFSGDVTRIREQMSSPEWLDKFKA